MPSDSFYDPPTWSTAKVANYVGRNRNWTNTAGYSSVPRPNLPENPYRDTQEQHSQVQYSGGYDIFPDGHVVTVVSPHYQWTGVELQQFASKMYDAAHWDNVAKEVSDQSVVRLLSKIADQKANFAVIAAEAHKTADLVLSSASRVLTAYRQFVRGNLKGVSRTLGIARSAHHRSWLEYKYGWMPLLMDIKGVAEAYADRIAGPARPPRFTVKVVSREDIKYSQTTSYAAYGGGSPGYYTESLLGTYVLTHELTLEVVNPEMVQLQQMGLTNPLEVAWELIPFSFVADWFISVGDWLRGLTALNGLRIVSGWYSNVNHYVAQYEQPQTIRYGNGHTYINGRYSHRSVIRDYGRGPFTLTGIAALPRLRNPVNNLDRLVTGLALLKGQFRGLDGLTRSRLRV